MKLSEELEQCVFRVIFDGGMASGDLDSTELSKVGQCVLAAVQFLETGGSGPPFKPKEVLAAAVDLFGADKSQLLPYLKRVVSAQAGAGTQEILGAVRSKLAALRTIQLLSDQIASGHFDLSTASSALHLRVGTGRLTSLATQQGDRLVSSLQGLSLGHGFAQLQDASGGLFGLWIIGGEPAIGKSTLALQLAIEVSQHRPVLYYDFENGPQVVLHRLGLVFKTVEEVRNHTTQIYLRDTIATLDQDLLSLDGPAVIVVDSFQSIPTRGLQRRQDLDGWLGKFERLKKEGHHVLLVSEINRALYDKASNKGFKETGEIEYKADLAVMMVGNADTPELHVVKNRHGKYKGFISQLVRVNELQFAEIAAGQRTEDL